MNAKEPEPPKELLEFVARVGGHLAPSHDRRDHDRYQFTVPVSVQPLDDSFRPVGKPFAAVTRDLSAAGIGLLHTEPVESRHLALTIDSPVGRKNLTVRVLRCKAIGAFYDIGGSFVSRPDQPSQGFQTAP